MIAEDIADIKRDMATKPIIALHTQVNLIETQLRDMKHTKLQGRVAASPHTIERRKKADPFIRTGQF